MNKFILLAVTLMGLSACASRSPDFPHCDHDQELVKDKCVELNKAGKKVDAKQTHQMLKKLNIIEMDFN